MQKSLRDYEVFWLFCLLMGCAKTGVNEYLGEERRSLQEVAEHLNTTVKTVRKWRVLFLIAGSDGFFDTPRSGAPGKFDILQRCELVSIACNQPENVELSGLIIGHTIS